jgi:Leucine-rich repeat (LRR) protein
MKKRIVSLFALLLAAIAGLGCYWLFFNSDDNQDSVRLLKEMGAVVTVQENVPGRALTAVFRHTELSAEQFSSLRNTRRLQALYLIDMTLGDEAVPTLSELKELRTLDLSGTRVTDAGLAKLPLGLTGLILKNTAITNAGLEAVGSLTALEELDLTGAGVDDAGLKRLNQKFRRLILDKTNVTDAGLMHLDVTRLEVLSLPNLKLSDTFVARLGDAPELRQLNLENTGVTDAGLECLAKLNRLQILNLSGTKLSDASMPYIGQMSGLGDLRLSNTQLTNAGLASLKNCRRLNWLTVDHTKVSLEGLDKVTPYFPSQIRISR